MEQVVLFSLIRFVQGFSHFNSKHLSQEQCKTFMQMEDLLMDIFNTDNVMKIKREMGHKYMVVDVPPAFATLIYYFNDQTKGAKSE